MATNLSPADLAALQAQWQQYSGGGYNPSLLNYTDPTGGTYHITTGSSGGGIEQGGPDVFATGYVGDQVAGQNQTGDMQNMYDLYGKFLGSGAIPKDTSFQDFLIIGAGLATAGTLTALGAGGAAAGAGAAGTGGAGSGAFLGEGVASGIPAWDAAYTGAGGVLSGAAGAAGGAAGSAGAAGATGATAAGTAAGGSLLGGAGSLLGPAATILGGLAGAQGQQASSTQTREMTPWMVGPVKDDLIPKVQSLLAQQTAPGALAGFDQMKALGQSMLSQPIRPNGFNLFTGR